MKVCAEPGCPTPTTGTRCPEHQRTTTQRGYGSKHQRERARWQRVLDQCAHITCANPNCITPTIPVDPRRWHLGHEVDRSIYRGPEHPECNLREAGQTRHTPWG